MKDDKSIYGKFPCPAKSHAKFPAESAVITPPSDHTIRPAGLTVKVLAHDLKCAPVIINGGDWVDLLTSKEYILK